MKVVKSGIINGKQFEGRILTDTVPFLAALVLINEEDETQVFTQMFPTVEAAENCIIETWDELENAKGEDK